MSATALWWLPLRRTPPTTVKSPLASSCPGRTHLSGPCRRSSAGATTAQRDLGPPALLIGQPRQQITSLTSSVCLYSASSCPSWWLCSATESYCPPSDRWVNMGMEESPCRTCRGEPVLSVWENPLRSAAILRQPRWHLQTYHVLNHIWLADLNKQAVEQLDLIKWLVGVYQLNI